MDQGYKDGRKENSRVFSCSVFWCRVALSCARLQHLRRAQLYLKCSIISQAFFFAVSQQTWTFWGCWSKRIVIFHGNCRLGALKGARAPMAGTVLVIQKAKDFFHFSWGMCSSFSCLAAATVRKQGLWEALIYNAILTFLNQHWTHVLLPFPNSSVLPWRKTKGSQHCEEILTVVELLIV